MKKQLYIAPEIEVQAIRVEKGFAAPANGEPSDVTFGGDLSDEE